MSHVVFASVCAVASVFTAWSIEKAMNIYVHKEKYRIEDRSSVKIRDLLKSDNLKLYLDEQEKFMELTRCVYEYGCVGEMNRNMALYYLLCIKRSVFFDYDIHQAEYEAALISCDTLEKDMKCSDIQTHFMKMNIATANLVKIGCHHKQEKVNKQEIFKQFYRKLIV